MSPPPARRRQRLSAETRRTQLVAATVEVVATRGYAGATADAIAAQAGVSKGLLWHYFADLDALMEHTARGALMTLARAVAERIDLDAPAPALVRAAIRAAVDVHRTRLRERTAIREIAANLRGPDGSKRLGPGDYDDLYTAQETIFGRGQDEGDLRADVHPRLLAITYQGAVDGMLAYLEAHPGEDADALAASVADVLLGGMRSAD